MIPWMIPFKAANKDVLTGGELTVWGLPAFTDNVLWVMVHESTHQALAIDPGCGNTVMGFLNQHGLHLSGILLTHHHADHVGGVEALQKRQIDLGLDKVVVYGPKHPSMTMVNHLVHDGQTLNPWPEHFPTQFITSWHVPGHTLSHMAFVCWADVHTPWLFCGDTLFSGGCGRLFEGSPQDMWKSLSRIRALPHQTLIFCAHEYTLQNLRFARQLPDNDPIWKHCPELRQGVERAFLHAHERNMQKQSTIPTPLGWELSCNVFLQAPNAHELGRLRALKDHFQ